MGRGMDSLGRGNALSIIGGGSFAYWLFCGLRVRGICCYLCVGAVSL